MRKLFLNPVRKMGPVVLSLFCIFTSCEIGLGSAVDVEAPKLSIQYPDDAVTIREAFVISGTCSDDQGVTAVNVHVRNTSTNHDYGVFGAEIDGNEWKITLNTKDADGNFPFLDGRYVAEINAADQAGKKSGTSSISFDIDNTPPLFIMSTPGSGMMTSGTGSNKVAAQTKFGSIFKIGGTIADDHDIAKMIVRVYELDSADETVKPDFSDPDNLPVPFATFEETTVETAGGTSINVASYDKDISIEDLITKSGRYKKLLNGGNTEKRYWCSVELIDKAKVYTNSPDDADKTGNSTNGVVFLYDDVYDKWLSSASGFDAAQVKKVINGTYKGNASETAVTEVKNLFENKKTQVAAFSINPKANPTYKVMGYTEAEKSKISETKNNATAGNKIGLTITCGLDGTLLDPASMKCYVFGPYETADAATITKVFESGLKADGSFELDDFYTTQHTNVASTSKAYETGTFGTNSAESIQAEIETPANIVGGKYYFVGLRGKDKEGREVLPDGYSVFKGYIAQTAPVLEWKKVSDNPADLATANDYYNDVDDMGVVSNKKLHFYGTLSAGGGSENFDANAIKAKITVIDEETNTQVGSPTTKEVPWELVGSEMKWKFSIDTSSVSAEKEYLYSIELSCKNKNNFAAVDLNHKIHVDTKKPVVKINSITPEAIKEIAGAAGADPTQLAAVNGKIKVSGTVTETNLEEVWYNVFIDGDETGLYPEAADKSHPKTLGSVYSFNPEIKTTETGFTDDKNIKIVVYARDKAGNVGEYDSTTLNSNTSYIVYQDSDKPVINFSNGDLTVTDAAVTAGTKSIDPDSNLFNTSSNNKLNFVITDDDGISVIEIYKRERGKGYEWTDVSNVEKIQVPGGNKTSKSVNYSLGSEEKEYEIRVVVKDIYAGVSGESLPTSSTEAIFVVAVDDGAPELNVLTSNGKDVFKPSKETIRITGTTNDTEENGARIKVFSDKECTTELDSTGYPSAVTTVNHLANPEKRLISKTANAAGLYDWAFDFNTAESGTNNKFYIQITDKYGQATVKEFVYSVDKFKPTFTITSLNGENYDAAQTEKFGSKANIFKIVGNVSDIPSGTDKTSSGLAESFYYKLVKDGDAAPAYDNSILTTWSKVAIQQSAADNSYFYSIPADFSSGYVEGGKYVLYMAGIDNAGNISDSAENPTGVVKITIDSVGPELKPMVLDATDTADVKLAAKAKDPSGINKFVLYRNNSKYEGMTPVISDGTGADDGFKIATYTITPADLVVGENVFKFVAIDEATNETETTAAQTITIDNTAPVFSSLNTSIPASAYQKSGFAYLNSKNGAAAGGIANSTGNVKVTGANNKLKVVSWKDTYDNEGTPADLLSSDASFTVAANGNFAMNLIPPAASKADYEGKFVTRTVTAENIFGLKSTWEIKFVWDTVKPELITADSLIGGVTVPALKIGGKSVEAGSGAGAAAGGVNPSELSETWFNSTAIKVDGAYKENGSGIKEIKYSINGGTASESFATKRDGYETFGNTISGFTESVTGRTNVVKFWATDNGENGTESDNFAKFNVKVDLTAPKVSDIKFRYENEAAGSERAAESAILTNKTQNIIFTGNYSDVKTGYESSGVTSIVAKINGKDFDAVMTPVGGTGSLSGTWTVTVDFAELTGTYALGNTGSYSVIFGVTDAAGNIDESSTAALKIDCSEPKVEVESPAVAATTVLNGKNVFSGKVAENNNPKSIQLYYVFKKAGDATAVPASLADWNELTDGAESPASAVTLKKTVGVEGVTIGDVSNWKFENVNINACLGTEVKGKLYVLPVAYDEAGNCNIKPEAIVAASGTAQGYVAFDVDLDSDRPVLKFSNLPWDSSANSGAGGVKPYIKNLTTLNGTITDDDGVSELRIAVTSDGTKPADLLTNAEYKRTVSSGAFAVPLGDDGTKNLWIYVKDSAGGEFVTAYTSSPAASIDYLKRPYVIFDGNVDASGKDKKSDDIASITFVSNSHAPVITELGFGFAETKDDAEANVLEIKKAAASQDTEKYSKLGTSNYAGGVSKKYASFGIKATTATGLYIESVILVVSGVNDGAADAPFAFTETESGSGIWTSAGLDVMASGAGAKVWTEGTHTLTFTVKDISGFETIESKQITIDKTGPSVSLISPGEDEVTGVIELKGTSSDDYSDVAEIGYLIIDNRYYSATGTLNADAQEKAEAEAKTAAGTEWYSGRAKSWTFSLDGIADQGATLDRTNAKLPAGENDVANATTGISKTSLAKDAAGNDKTDIYNLVIMFYAKDSLGNESFTPVSGSGAITIQYAPYGDRPSCEVTYPEGKRYEGAGLTPQQQMDYVTGYSNVNGSIRVTGAASDNKSISNGKVLIQLDLNKDGKFDDEDKDAAIAAGYKVIDDITDITYWNDTTASGGNWNIPSLDASGVTYYSASGSTKWGILANGTNSWNFTLNRDGELKIGSYTPPAAAGGTGTTTGACIGQDKYKIGVRSIAIDSSGVFGRWSEGSYFMIDMNVPQINKASVVNSADSTTSQIYTEDMYLRGKQYLKLEVADLTGIKQVSVAVSDNMNNITSPKKVLKIDVPVESSGFSAVTGVGTYVYIESKTVADGYLKDAIVAWDNPDADSNTFKNYRVYIPVSDLTAVSGKDSVAMKVTVYKNSDSDSTTYERYAMSFDNVKPTVEKTTLNGIEADTTAGTLANRIVNSNGLYFTLGGKIMDEASGFERIAFYYYRDAKGTDGHKRRVFDPDPASVLESAERSVQVTANTSTALTSGIKMVEVETTEADAADVKKAPLYGYEVGITVDASSGLKITLASDSNKHIRAGGLVQINGTWHVIAAKNGTELTLGTETTALTATKAFFPIAQVIDNLGAEKTDANGDLQATESGDDGDLMPESVIKAGTHWTYDASIHSNYISDGPGKLVLMIWDRAGNAEIQILDASVQNNAPRLTKLWLGNDLGGTGFSEESFTEYDVLAKAGEQSSYEMATATYNNKKRFRVKGDLAVVAEFVGGNNASGSTDGSRIKMAFREDANSTPAAGQTYLNPKYTQMDGATLAASTNIYSRDSELSEKTWFVHSSGYETGELENFAYKIDKEKLGADSTLEGTVFSERAMSFTFWDDTDETDQCVNSCYAFLKLTDLIVMIDDNFAPTVAIDPFFWKNSEENSLYENSYLNGHIDLPTETGATLDFTTGLFKKGTTLVGGSDTNKPKVSGTVSVRGTALDEHTLGSIWVAFTNKAGTASVFTPAEGTYYEKDNAATPIFYKVAEKTSDGWETKAGTYTSSGWSEASTPVKAAADKWKFTILNDKSTLEGELVEWQLDIDTSNMAGAMANDVVFRVSARDEVYDKCGSATADGGKHENKSPADHISKTTTAGSLDLHGKYDLTVEGTNIPSYIVDVVPYIGNVLDKNGNAANRSRLGRYPVRAGEQITLKGFNFPASPAPTVTRHKTASGSAAAAVAETIAATDVTYVDARTIKIKAPQKSGYINVSFGTVKCPNNSNDNTTYNIQKGYLSTEAVTYGKAKADEKGTNFWTDDVYLSVWNNNGVMPDSLLPLNGTIETFGDTVGKIFNGSTEHTFTSASRKKEIFGLWGSNAKMMYNSWFEDGANRLNGLSYQANCAYKLPPAAVDTAIIDGEAFYVVLDNSLDNSGTWGSGLVIYRNGQEMQQNSSQSKPVEIQGNGNSDTPDSSDGLDEVLFQFKNPKIAGTKIGNVFHIYTSYYDSYARCLKYGYFTFTGEVSNTHNDKAQVVATYGNEKSGIAVVDGCDTLQNNFSGDGWDCGEFSDIKVTKEETTPIPVIAYYSNSSKKEDDGGSGIQGLRIARASIAGPTTYRVDKAITDTPSGTWNITDVEAPNNLTEFGRNVSMEMDSNGGLHIICQGKENGSDSYQLWYLYLEYNSGSKKYETKDAHCIDSTSSVGKWSDIKLSSPENKGPAAKPYITYMNEACLNSKKAVKIAYVESASVVDSKYTSSWECMTDPSNHDSTDQKLSIVLDVYDNEPTPQKNTLAVGINADVFVIDCLRDE